jgi:serine/threonine protein kinase
MENDIVKLADFGISKSSKTENLASISDIQSISCIRAYSVLEVTSGSQYNGRPADIYSAGMVLYFMLSGSVPVKGKPLSTILVDTPSAVHLICWMTDPDPDPEYRATLEDIRDFPWFTEDYVQQFPYPHDYIDLSEPPSPDLYLSGVTCFDLFSHIAEMNFELLLSTKKKHDLKFSFSSKLPIDRISEKLKAITLSGHPRNIIEENGDHSYDLPCFSGGNGSFTSI